MSDWCILRTKARDTLALAESLNRHGLEAWAPSWMRRIPRRRDEAPAPLLPTFVFARAKHLTELLMTASTPTKPHPDFSVFHYDHRIPLVAESELNALRMSERRAVPRHKQRTFSRGEAVVAHDGAWAGLPGIVEQDSGKFVLVAFGRIGVKISRFLLDPEECIAA